MCVCVCIEQQEIYAISSFCSNMESVVVDCQIGCFLEICGKCIMVVITQMA